MSNKICPQCKIRRFRIKNDADEWLVVTVTKDNQIIPIHPEQSIDGFDLEVLYCLGCSWKGSVKKLT